jgi:hypothetical protein
MSSVKNTNDVGAAIGNLWNSVAREGQRALDEANKLVTESINDIGKAIESGGFVGAAMQAFEELSPGNFAAGTVDVLTGPGQLNPQLAAGIRGAVNFAVGTLVPGAALPLQVSALVDAARAFGLMGGAPMTPGAGHSPAARKTQTPERPGDAAGRTTSPEGQNRIPEEKRKAIEEAKKEARREMERLARENIQNARIGALEDRVARLEKLLGLTEGRPAGGYSPATGLLDVGDISVGFVRIDFDKLKPGRLKDNVDKANSEIDKILNNPNLSFEDMIFLLMRAVMKEQQAEVKEMTKELRGKKDKFETEKVGLRAAVDKADKAVMEAQARFNKNPGDESAAKGLADARANLRAAEAALNDKTTEFNDSRAEQLEVIKNAMQKLTEMQQALSNILNTMHQTAMNTIGNIR